LPTEAQWEYACRAGTTTPFNTGYNLTTDQANYNGNYPYNNNAKGQYREKTLPVGSFLPNGWGLYDMHGNVREWCLDWYGEYLTKSQTNPKGLASGSCRVLRGGSWNSFAQYCRSADRTGSAPSDNGYGILGFRVVIEP
jgi:formylglycine-generating enzyme required for sulfatase activity